MSAISPTTPVGQTSKISLFKWRGDLGVGTVALILLLFTLALRVGLLGNPAFHVDQQFYFMVADRMWRGDLPYVEIWDRKPIGLFLIYAALRPFSGDSMISVQIAGMMFSVAAAVLIWDMVRPHLGRNIALLPALLYIAWMGPFGGANGQSPVFYNPMVLAGAWMLLKAVRETEPKDLFWRGCLIMLLVGLAIQIKYTAVFEGSFFGLFLMYLEFSRGATIQQVLVRAAVWSSIALAPTVLALGYFAVLGHADQFIWANFVSIFYRDSLDTSFLISLIRFIIIRGAPLWVLGIFGAYLLSRMKLQANEKPLLFGWLIAAFIGFISVGNFYDHYALPMIAPVCVMASFFFVNRARHIAIGIFASLIVLAGLPNPWMTHSDTMRSRDAIHGLTASAEPYLADGCMFIFDGPSVLYATTGSCILTKFAYPDHLSNAVEADALGVDSVAEMQRVLDAKPSLIMTTTRGLIPVWNGPNRRKIDDLLASDYVLIDSALEGFETRYYLLHARKDLAAKHNAKPVPLPSQVTLLTRQN